LNRRQRRTQRKKPDEFEFEDDDGNDCEKESLPAQLAAMTPDLLLEALRVTHSSPLIVLELVLVLDPSVAFLLRPSGVHPARLLLNS
jgi:hypothetical protein